MTISLSEVLTDLARVKVHASTIDDLIAKYNRRFETDMDGLRLEIPALCAWCGKPLEPDADPWFDQGICYLCALSRD